MSYSTFLEAQNKNLRDSAYGWQEKARQYSIVIDDKDKRIKELQERIEELQDVANHTKRHNDYLIIQNEELEARNKILDDVINKNLKDTEAICSIAKENIEQLEAQNKILVETDHWIGQDEAYDLKIAVENFLAEPFFGPQEYRNLREALNACNPHRGSNFDDFLKEDSENRD